MWWLGGGVGYMCARMPFLESTPAKYLGYLKLNTHFTFEEKRFLCPYKRQIQGR